MKMMALNAYEMNDFEGLWIWTPKLKVGGFERLKLCKVALNA